MKHSKKAPIGTSIRELLAEVDKAIQAYERKTGTPTPEQHQDVHDTALRNHIRGRSRSR
jgi:hypothetical protein